MRATRQPTPEEHAMLQTMNLRQQARNPFVSITWPQVRAAVRREHKRAGKVQSSTV